MAGLISDIGSVCNTFDSGQKALGFGSDILNNLGKSLGITDRKTYPDEKLTNIYSNARGITIGNDIRGIRQVFRDFKYSFKYDRDFKCYNDDFYFKNQKGKQFRNSIQQVKLYQFQPYHQTQLGTEISIWKDKLKTEKGRQDAADQFLSEMKRSNFK